MVGDAKHNNHRMVDENKVLAEKFGDESTLCFNIMWSRATKITMFQIVPMNNSIFCDKMLSFHFISHLLVVARDILIHLSKSPYPGNVGSKGLLDFEDGKGLSNS